MKAATRSLGKPIGTRGRLSLASWTLCACTLLGLAGCGLLQPKPLKTKKAKKKSGKQGSQGQGGAKAKPAGAQYAGEWTRASDKAAFKVEEAGGVVKGSLVKGSRTAEGKEFYAFYTFELKREGKLLKGQAKFALAEYPDDKYESAWEVELEGDTIKGKAESLALDDEGKVEKRTFEPCSFAFKGSAKPAAAAAPAPAAYKMDLTTMVQAPGKLMLGEEAAVGMKVDVDMKASGRSMPYSVAIVGEEGESWRVETTQGLSAYAAMSPDAKSMVIGLLVAKEGGKVTRARLGKPGEAGKTIKIAAAGAAAPAKQPEGEETEVELSFGKLPAKKYKTGAMTTFVGTEGVSEGVLLKIEGGAAAKAVKAEPTEEEVDLGGTKVRVKKAVYDNGDENWSSAHAAVKALQYGMVLNKSKYATVQIKSVASDAKAQLKW